MSTASRFRPLLRGVLVAIVAFFVVYLVGANVVLNTDVLDPVINKKREKSLIEWESGWTIFPGVIHVEGLRFRGQSLKQQWQFTLAEADVRMNLFALPWKKVRASRVVGRDFSFRQRPRLSADAPAEAGAEYFPEIPGLSNPPDPAPEDIYPPKRKKKRGWNIRISDIDLEGDLEVAVNQLRLAGAGRAGGDFAYQIRGEMYLPTSYLDLEGSVIQVAGTTFVNEVYLKADSRLGPFVPKQTKGIAIFDHLVGSVALENGTIPDVEVLNTFFTDTSPIRFTDGTASFNWSFDKESTESGSHGDLSISAEGADLLMGGRAISADLGLEARLERGSLAEGSWALGETTLALDKVDVRLLKSDEEARAAAASPPSPDDLWWMRFTIRKGAVDLGDPTTLSADFRFRMKNTDPLLHMFLAKPTSSGGAKLPGWAKLLPDVTDIEGRGGFRVDEAGMHVENVVIDGDEFDLIAMLDGHGGSADGGLFLRYKGHSVGVEVENGRKDLKILRPKRWFLEQEMFRDEWPIVEALMSGGGRDSEQAEEREKKAEKEEKKKAKKEKKKKGKGGGDSPGLR